MPKLKYTEHEITKRLFRLKGDPPFCFKKAYVLIRKCIAFINKLGLKGELLLDSNEFDREAFELFFEIEKANPNKVIEVQVDKEMKERGF
ncbi:MAG: hypothetical protein [Lokiarchaeia virus VerdaV1]|uniref:Uncharacterized protein n=1 Tax=Lokiarchaeia virus VerdaV1 TaxID=3070170 RepID=A0AA35CR86_9CAUD|nr:MAG: hypothetical protein QIT41_gp32 [Lokiarchaeia virus VerdaV1]BDI54881.1 MAG: hypothetical protein [Lokiarchaeia virus VerdaV1]